jgi:hypothetical protein
VVDFDRTVVITLSRRPDRIEGFLARLPAGWAVEAYDAIDGLACPKPEWFMGSEGAWGCYRSHQRIIEEALNRGHESVLIFEDDATFVPDFDDRLRDYLAALPEDWGQADLGGQHLKPAEPVNERVVRAVNVNRTHAYILRGRKFLERVYLHMHGGHHWRGRHHVDHHFGRLHARRVPAYAPTEWLCGQASGSSDVSGKEVAERWWVKR